MKSLIKKIQNFAGRYGLWEEGSKIIVGVSSGPDSVCLLDILVKLALKYSFKLRIAHVNYGLRGKDSDGDEKFVRELAEKYGLGFDVLDARTPPLDPPLKEGERSEDEISLTPNPSPRGRGRQQISENRMREIRYDFFEKIRKRKKYNLIAVAHNRDDQAETVLMRVLRGAGLQGLAAMRPKTPHPSPLPKGERGNIIIRPLLNTSRKEILEYLKENKLKYQTDITNKDIKIFRNKIRHRLIPYLEKNYNPNIKKTLSGMALIVADDYDYLLTSMNMERQPKAGQPRAEMLKQINANADGKNKIIFSAKKFQKLHPAIQRQYLRQIISQIKTGLVDIEACHIEEIVKIIKSGKSKTQTVEFRGLKITRIGDRVSVVKV